jgi:hypothetical protein
VLDVFLALRLNWTGITLECVYRVLVRVTVRVRVTVKVRVTVRGRVWVRVKVRVKVRVTLMKVVVVK